MTIKILRRVTLFKQIVLMGQCTFFLSGCTLSVPQAESSYRLIRDLISSDVGSSAEQQAVWLASVGGYGAVLRPYLSGGFTVFANTDGDAIAFDGWTIRSIMGFGLTDTLSISGKEGRRIFSGGAELTSTECDPWRLTEFTWRQTCANGNGTIALNDEGNIEMITLSVGGRVGTVTLRVVE